MQQVKFSSLPVGATFRNKSSRSTYKRLPDNFRTKAGRAEWVANPDSPELVGKSCVYPKNSNVLID